MADTPPDALVQCSFSDPDLVAHLAHPTCGIEAPHKIDDCGRFLKAALAPPPTHSNSCQAAWRFVGCSCGAATSPPSLRGRILADLEAEGSPLSRSAAVLIRSLIATLARDPNEAVKRAANLLDALTEPQHHCGVEGWDPIVDPPCPACQW